MPHLALCLQHLSETAPFSQHPLKTVALWTLGRFGRETDGGGGTDTQSRVMTSQRAEIKSNVCSRTLSEKCSKQTEAKDVLLSFPRSSPTAKDTD